MEQGIKLFSKVYGGKRVTRDRFDTVLGIKLLSDFLFKNARLWTYYHGSAIRI
jgi:hypothetical protein